VVLASGSGDAEAGLTVASIKTKSPAAEAGLKPGDVITSVDKEKLQRGLDFHRAMLDREAGEDVQLRIRRGGSPKTLKLTLASSPKESKPLGRPAWELLGLELAPVPVKDFRRRHQTRYRGGLAVTAVRPDGPAAEAGFRPGDVLVGMHVWETVTLENVSYILKRPDIGSLNPMKFFVLRGSETLYGYLPITVKTAQRP
jgi:serine protease Do